MYSSFNETYDQFREQVVQQMDQVKSSVEKLEANMRFFTEDNTQLRNTIEAISRAAGEQSRKVTSLFKGAKQNPAGHGIYGEGAESEDFTDLSREFFQTMNSLSEVQRSFQQIVNPNQAPTISGPGGEYSPPSQHMDMGGGAGYEPPSQPMGINASHDGMSLELVYRGDSVDQEIEQENREAAMYIAREATAIKDAMHDMQDILGEQSEKLNHVDQEVEEVVHVVKKADEHLQEAQKHQAAKKKIIIITIIVVVVIVLLGTAALLIYLAMETDIFKAPKKLLR